MIKTKKINWHSVRMYVFSVIGFVIAGLTALSNDPNAVQYSADILLLSTFLTGVEHKLGGNTK